MDIEDLSKSQLLLLMVLVNFVISIATSVLTVSLLDEAPPIVTQTVNRIVDRTIETVTELPNTFPETIIIKDEDLITAAIAQTVSRTVSLKRSVHESIFGTGIYLSDARAVAVFLTEFPKELTVVFSDGSSLPATLFSSDVGIAVYRFAPQATVPDISTPKLIVHTDVKQGQTVVSLASDGSAVIGIVSRIDDKGVLTTLPETPPGSPAVNLNGDILGIRGDTSGLYLSAERITSLLAVTGAP